MPVGNVMWPFFHKRLSFAHEREFRALILGCAEGPDPLAAGVPRGGFAVPVDIETLVETLYVKPGAAGWFTEAVRAVVKSFGFSFPVKQSQLDIEPIH